ncbi:MAG: 5-oxoprolinase subunit PxpB [Crenarchaeota archaeon]|nr:5-oxoprolinase subunit PxpB [Thermoproteota archaeon]
MVIYERPKVRRSGGYVIHVELCNEISLDCNKLVHALYYKVLETVKEGSVRGIEEVVPAYSSLSIFYDPRQASWRRIAELIESLWSEARATDVSKILKPRRFRIPVVYGGEYGPDLPSVAEHAKLDPDEVVRIHTSRTYVCYMLGFTPGFVYLGDVDERIATPRLPSPRTRVAPGSVGIAGRQTGIYGVESPGGWRLIGRTPLKTFDPRRDPPTPIRPGDLVEFYRIEPEEFEKLRGVYLGEVIQ